MIATHPRSFDRRQQIEEPAHIQALVARSVPDARIAPWIACTTPPPVPPRSSRAPPSAACISARSLAGLSIYSTATVPPPWRAALAAALAQVSAHLAAVRHFIDQQRARRGACPAHPGHAAGRSARAALTVRPHTSDRLPTARPGGPMNAQMMSRRRRHPPATTAREQPLHLIRSRSGCDASTSMGCWLTPRSSSSSPGSRACSRSRTASDSRAVSSAGPTMRDWANSKESPTSTTPGPKSSIDLTRRTLHLRLPGAGRQHRHRGP